MKVGLRDRIIIFISKSATRSDSKWKLPTLLAGSLFATGLFLLVMLAFWTDRWLSLPPIPSYPMNLMAGMPLLAAGIWLWLWSVLTFMKTKGTPVPLRPPPVLITTGPYAFSRNPMLTGIFFIFFGIGFTMQSFSLVFFYTPLFILFAYLEFRWIEEPELENRLGEAYKEYKRKTPMFYGKKRG